MVLCPELAKADMAFLAESPCQITPRAFLSCYRSARPRSYLVTVTAVTADLHSQNGKLWNVRRGLFRLDVGSLDDRRPPGDLALYQRS
jgi:hypothetical protein